MLTSTRQDHHVKAGRETRDVENLCIACDLALDTESDEVTPEPGVRIHVRHRCHAGKTSDIPLT